MDNTEGSLSDPVETHNEGTRKSGSKLRLYAGPHQRFLVADDIVHTVGNNRLICKAAKLGVPE